MLSFKDFLNRDSFTLNETFSHEGVGHVGQQLDDMKKTLIGRSSTAKFVRDYKVGIPVTFGVDKKNGANFVSDGKHTFYSPDDVDGKYKPEDPRNASMKKLLQHTHRIVPREGGTYSAQFLNFGKTKDGYQTEDGARVHKDSPTGKAIKNSQISLILNGKHDLKGDVKHIHPSKMVNDPAVHVIDPVIRNHSPANFTPEEQHAYNHHILNANKSYASLKPDVFDNLGNHHKEIQAFVSAHPGDKPPKLEEYTDYLQKKHTEKIVNSMLPKQKDRAARELSDLLGTVTPQFGKVIAMQHHLKGAHNVLKDVISRNQPEIDAPHDVNVHYKGYKTKI